MSRLIVTEYVKFARLKVDELFAGDALLMGRATARVQL
jgi:hypothetical protein